MPWKEVSVMDAREEFVSLAMKEGANVRELCRRFGVSAAAGYKWLARYERAGRGGLADRSRRPRHSPGRTDEGLEARMVELRGEHPRWGARKLRARLAALGVHKLPSVSTTHAILKRHGLIDAHEGLTSSAFERFEHAQPNAFWQMDFKGHFALLQGRCHPLSVLDDHSRYNLCLQAPIPLTRR
jgi:transposase